MYGLIHSGVAPSPAYFASSGNSEPRPAPGRVRVLVVDDNPDTVISLLAVLRDEGYDAEGMADARRTIAEVETFRPDVLIVDIAMPNVSGWDIAREVRKLSGKKPMLIAISGVYDKTADQLVSRAAGFSHFLRKPCEPNFLLNILAAVFPGK
ncbi:hypothetical protein AYO46_00720 [Betaproteobacteria bacterium SCGC AG-212-J23]|nr:hypothetical protein AYO46_00720 [Betaproteobacteria bacterium SCGC AG-212-J23]